MHGAGHVDNEGEDGHDDECHKGMRIHQSGRASSANLLTLHSIGDFFPLSNQVLDATSGSVQWITRPAQSSGIIQDPYAPRRGPR